jgi:hypothetical protein
MRQGSTHAEEESVERRKRLAVPPVDLLIRHSATVLVIGVGVAAVIALKEQDLAHAVLSSRR